MNDQLDALHDQFESQKIRLRDLNREVHLAEIRCRDKESRKIELTEENRKLKSGNENIIELIEVHEETKICIEKEKQELLDVSDKMKMTMKAVNCQIEEASSLHENDLQEMDEAILYSKQTVEKNKELKYETRSPVTI